MTEITYRIEKHHVREGGQCVVVFDGDEMVGTFNCWKVEGRRFASFISKDLRDARIDYRTEPPGIVMVL
jgi:hypothetical protein